MPCYHPQLLLYDGLNENGKPIYKFTGIQGTHKRYFDRSDPRDVLIPCRKCIGCRLDYSRRWADRLMLELDHSKTALFFTLTYDDEHVTPAMYDDELDCFWYTLVKKDLQDFNKRLRFHFSHKKIRFFAAGEYGDKTLRPHYHGIYFGLSLSDFPDLELLSLNVNNQPLYTSPLLRKIWKNGHVSIGNVSWQSCAYVARYNLKKLSHGNDDVAALRNCVPEFGLMSRQPGIGGYFFYDHPEFFDNPRDKIFLSDPFGVKSVDSIYLPSYHFEKMNPDKSDPTTDFGKDLRALGIVNPELYAKIKSERQEASLDSFFAELEKTDLDEYEYLIVKEVNHDRRSKSLVRSL